MTSSQARPPKPPKAPKPRPPKPVSPKPSRRPGNDLFGEYEEQLLNTGCEVIDPLAAWVDAVVASAPPLTDDQRAGLSRILGGQARAA